jgi:uncharacterized protein (TIGR02147 family)
MRPTRLQKLAKTLQVTAYLDYRDYLADLYEKAKAETSPYSYLVFAEDLGFSAINMLRLVIHRQRALSARSAQTVVKGLGLHRADRKYFLALVAHAHARGPKARDAAYKKMLEAKQESIVSFKDKNRMEYYSAWHHPVIYEMLRLDEVVKDPVGLATALYPTLNAEKVQRSLALLESIGLVAIDPQTGAARRLEEGPMIMPTDATAGHLSIGNFHLEMLDAAKEALVAVPTESRDFNAITVCLSDAGFEALRAKLRAVCEEAMALEGEATARRVVTQVNIQLFALTRGQS